MILAEYHFRSYLRRGLGNLIEEADTLGDSNNISPNPISGRPKIQGKMSLKNADPAHISSLNFPIVGPGDVLGFSVDMVIRTEPVRGNTNFPPNYLAHIEFYEENLPWRYTPAKIEDHKLRPWIFLLVLKENEWGRLKETIPLPRIKLINAPPTPTPLPPATETWAWAHVQETGHSTLSGDKINPDRIFSRLICPRRLEENTAYHAFVVPAFESGRLAGLGKPETDVSPKLGINNVLAQMPAQWADEEGIPVYYEWNFHTGLAADFEYLAGLLKPRDTNGMVGRRAIDLSNPGFGVPASEAESLHVMEAALKSLNMPESDELPLPASTLDLNVFKSTVSDLINLPRTRNGDPVVPIPFYGQKHRRVKSLNAAHEGWLSKLNLNPGYRAAAGVGAEVIRKYQHDYMARAWEQLESIVEANKTIVAAVAAMNVCQVLFRRWIAPLPAEELLALTAPVHKKIRIANPVYVDEHTPQGITIFHIFRQSCQGNALMNSGFRRIARRRGPWMRRLARKTGKSLDLKALSERVADKRRESVMGIFYRANNENLALYSLSSGNFNSMLFLSEGPLFPAREVQLFYDRDGEVGSEFDHALQRLWDCLPPKHVLPTCSDGLPTGWQQDIVPAIKEAIQPTHAFPALLVNVFPTLTGWFDKPEQIVPAMAYPDFTDPMFEKLKEISLDWFIPNLHLLPRNSITMLESNQAFIEAYMVGLNVEMGREMRWREYPTDERGSCFRQFWDVKGILPLNADVKNDKDITRIHTWTDDSLLASHENRPAEAGEDKLTLAVRGDLLKCYPNTAVYAMEAHRESNGKFVLKASGAIKYPIYKAEVEGDVHFLGFDLTKTTAQYSDNDAGWFFIFQEIPGETRCRLDLGELPAGSGTNPIDITSWDEMSWAIVGKPAILNTSTPNITTHFPANSEDATVEWGKNAADMAYILYQKPVMIAIHANELIHKKRTGGS